MFYNTTKSNLKFREYGRYIQDLVTECKTIEDRTKRQAFAERIIDCMLMLTPPPKNMDDHILKLWTHIMHLADYDLDVDVPVKIIRYERLVRPNKLAYPSKQGKYRHYGRYIFDLIEEAVKNENEEERKHLTNTIASFMKLSYINWNRDSVTDDIIDADLREMSKGKLSIEPDADLDVLINPSKKSKHQTTKFQNMNQSAQTPKVMGNVINSGILGVEQRTKKKKKKPVAGPKKIWTSK